MNIIKLQEVSKSYSKITNPFKILLPFWVLMIFLKKISSLSPELEKFKNSFLNLSSCLKFSLVILVDSLILNKVLLLSRLYWKVLVMNILKPVST